MLVLVFVLGLPRPCQHGHVHCGSVIPVLPDEETAAATDGDGDSAASRRHRCFSKKGGGLHIAGVPAVARDSAQASRACVLTDATSSWRSGG